MKLDFIDLGNSHFQRFLGVREELRAFTAEYPSFAPAHPAAVNPVLRKPPEAAGRVWLEDADAVAAVDLANAIYALSLRLLAGAYGQGVSDGKRPGYPHGMAAVHADVINRDLLEFLRT